MASAQWVHFSAAICRDFENATFAPFLIDYEWKNQGGSTTNVFCHHSFLHIIGIQYWINTTMATPFLHWVFQEDKSFWLKIRKLPINIFLKKNFEIHSLNIIIIINV